MTHDADQDPPRPLQAALHALPKERTPPAHVWSGIEAALRVPTPAPRAIRRRAVAAVGVVVVAATVAVALQRHNARPGAPVVAVSPRSAVAAGPIPTAGEEPLGRAVHAERVAWERAAADPVRSARWPAAARQAVQQALTVTDRAAAPLEATLRRTPGDSVTRAMLATLRAHQLEIVRQSLVILDEL